LAASQFAKPASVAAANRAGILVLKILICHDGKISSIFAATLWFDGNKSHGEQQS
jgi:hypothetical protein